MKEFLEYLSEHLTINTVIIIAAFILFIIGRLLFKRIKISSEFDALIDASRLLNCSEYEIFRKAGKEWNFSDHKTEEDFKRYLWHGEIPRYVKEFVSRILESG